MSKINLLPWRAELRKQQQQEFIAALIFGALATLGLMFLVHLQIASQIDYQLRRNKYLESEISILDRKIKEIQDLETKKKRLIAKMEVIQQLQTSRPEIVHLFYELGHTLPDGVFLSDFAAVDRNITINGVAQSNARVSNYMRNLENSAWVKNPVLNVIESRGDARDAKKERQSRFTLQVKQGSDKPDAKKKGAP
jgi:type IV pilus assembly protein PilN